MVGLPCENQKRKKNTHTYEKIPLVVFPPLLSERKSREENMFGVRFLHILGCLGIGLDKPKLHSGSRCHQFGDETMFKCFKFKVFFF